ncbi:class I adenylate-forming enzyme family protein [Sphingomonas bacterium]|uniref:class I adenylate-forming enzyme family protein n=1 Tax=Sphingomonas bacterium TaxID=1895847 RepID=UPI00157616C6|nr:class I adenylate-forming enzyme family protein [Sphingomonas bacterium]
MPSELDRRMTAAIAAMTADDGALPLGRCERFGRSLPLVASAPPSLPAYFARYCADHADATFLVAGAERLTFADVHQAATSVARALVAGYGVRKGDRVGIATRNSAAWIVLYMGIVMAGGVATLLNGWWQSEELDAALADVDCALVFADHPRRARLAATSARVVDIDDTLPLAGALAAVVARDDPAAVLPAIGPDDGATILFTSGSTGRAKGALSDHCAVVQATFSFLAQARAIRSASAGLASGYKPATLVNLPLFHVTGEVAVLLLSFALGRKLVLMPRWDAAEAMRLIEAERVTYFAGVPSMSFEIATHPRRDTYDLSSVTDFSAGGAPWPAEHVRRVAAALPGAPRIGYGLTESNAVGTANWRGNCLAKPGSAGPAARPLVEIAIFDPDGSETELPQGERGEVGIRSICNFRAYWGDPAATAAAFTADGFLRSGDIGYLDADGYLFIVGRKKDIVVRGGENVGCQEVEAALYQNPAVVEAAVFALPDERLGEVPGAVVHLAAGATVTPEGLRAFLAGRIAAFKVPARIWTSAKALPRLGTEKIDKQSLRARYAALAAAETV